MGHIADLIKDDIGGGIRDLVSSGLSGALARE